MSNIVRTVSYLKRNGIKNTCHTIMERLDKRHIEQIQQEIKNYAGAKYFSSIEKEEDRETTSNEQKIEQFDKEYLFSILVPAYETDVVFLKDLLDSVMSQTYGKLELILADASKSDCVANTVEAYERQCLPLIREQNRAMGLSYAESYPCIKYVRLEENGGISANTNKALEQAQGDYIGLLDHDDVLTYDALYEVMKKLQEHPYRMIYTDEDKSDGNMTVLHTPNIKPEFNFDMLLSNNYICHFAVLEAKLMKQLGFRQEYDGAQDYDLFLRAVAQIGKDLGGCHLCRKEIAHVDKVLYHWRCHETSTAANPESKRYAYEAGKRALEDFLSKNGIPAKVNHSQHLGFYHIEYTDSLFSCRPEIGAVCGRVIHKNKVVGGPTLDGRVLFQGLLKNYSGYMNRANFMLEVDEMDENAACFSPKYEQLFAGMEKEGKSLSFSEKCTYIKKHNDIFVYLPEYIE